MKNRTERFDRFDNAAPNTFYVGDSHHISPHTGKLLIRRRLASEPTPEAWELHGSPSPEWGFPCVYQFAHHADPKPDRWSVSCFSQGPAYLEAVKLAEILNRGGK